MVFWCVKRSFSYKKEQTCFCHLLIKSWNIAYQKLEHCLSKAGTLLIKSWNIKIYKLLIYKRKIMFFLPLIVLKTIFKTSS